MGGRGMIVTWRQTAWPGAWQKRGRKERSNSYWLSSDPPHSPFNSKHDTPTWSKQPAFPSSPVSNQSWRSRPESTAAWLYVGSGNLNSSCLHVCVISIYPLSHLPSLQLLSTVPVMAFSGKCCFSYLDPKLSVESIISFSFCLFSELQFKT